MSPFSPNPVQFYSKRHAIHPAFHRFISRVHHTVDSNAPAIMATANVNSDVTRMLRRAQLPGAELIKSLTSIGCISPLLLILYASVFPQVFDEECIIPAYFWTLFSAITEYIVLLLAWRHGLGLHRSTLTTWAGMMCVIGTAISVFSRCCATVSYQRAFIILGVWSPLLSNYGPVLIAMTRMAWSTPAAQQQQPEQEQKQEQQCEGIPTAPPSPQTGQEDSETSPGVP